MIKGDPGSPLIASDAVQDIWLNDGSGGFTESTFGGGGEWGVALGDLDGGDLPPLNLRRSTTPRRLQAGAARAIHRRPCQL